jgi:hypothetical protein
MDIKQKIVYSKNKELWINSILVVITTIITLYLLEYIVSHYSKDRHTVAYQNGVDFDKRNRFEIILDSKKHGLNLVPYFSPYYLMKQESSADDGNEIFPLSGLSNSLLIYCNESGEYSQYLSDRYGFNNSDVIHDSNIDVVLIGDSFVQGACVNNEYNIATQLKKNGKSVISLGAGGTGPLIQNAIFREYGDIRSKNVIWFFYEGNDMNNIISEQKVPFLKRYLNSNTFNNLKGRQPILDEMVKQFILEQYEAKKKKSLIVALKKSELEKFVTLYNFRSLVKRVFLGKKNKVLENYNKEIHTLISILQKVKQKVEKSGGNFYFVYLPSYSRIFDLGNVFPQKDKLIMMVQDKDIEVIDVYNDVFKDYNNPKKLFPFGLNGHYTPLGYKLLSQELLDVINSKKD